MVALDAFGIIPEPVFRALAGLITRIVYLTTRTLLAHELSRIIRMKSLSKAHIAHHLDTVSLVDSMCTGNLMGRTAD